MRRPQWSDSDYECISLDNLAIEIPVGLIDWERVPGKRQRLVISIEMYRHRGALAPNALDDCIDYARVFGFIDKQFGPDRPHTDFIETIAEEIIACCFDDPKIEACRVIVEKPHVLNGRASPRLEVYRNRPPN